MSISPSTLSFLKNLKANNNKQWFQSHKHDFEHARDEFTEFMRATAEAIATFDPLIRTALTDPKTIKVFRIYRDVRFSKDKSPYKTNLGGYIAPHGMEGGLPGYYLHIQPGESFAGGGLHMPDSKTLGNIRDVIAKDDKPLRNVLSDKRFTKHFKDLDRSYDTLKTVPRGYPKDHPAADLLKLKSFIAGKTLNDTEITSKAFMNDLVDTFKSLSLLVDYLAKIR